MICRIWHGWTTPDLADTYQTLLAGEIMPEIYARKIQGLLRHEAMRRAVVGADGNDEIEFTTIIWFRDIASIKGFVGDDVDVANLPGKARAILKRFEARSTHYEVFDQATAS